MCSSILLLLIACLLSIFAVCLIPCPTCGDSGPWGLSLRQHMQKIQKLEERGYLHRNGQKKERASPKAVVIHQPSFTLGRNGLDVTSGS